jgi:hypothetical protein
VTDELSERAASNRDAAAISALARRSCGIDAENTADAVRLYTSVGMTPRPTFTVWKRDLPLALGRDRR